MAENTENRMILYATSTCQALKAWLRARKITFKEHNVSDAMIMEEVKARTNVQVTPLVMVGDRIFSGTFAMQRSAIVDALGLYEQLAEEARHD